MPSRFVVMLLDKCLKVITKIRLDNNIYIGDIIETKNGNYLIKDIINYQCINSKTVYLNAIVEQE